MTEPFSDGPWPTSPGVGTPPLPPPFSRGDAVKVVGEGAAMLASRMQLVSGCIDSWRKAWRTLKKRERRQFARSVIGYALVHIEGYAAQVISHWLCLPGNFDQHVMKYANREQRQALVDAMMKVAVDHASDFGSAIVIQWMYNQEKWPTLESLVSEEAKKQLAEELVRASLSCLKRQQGLDEGTRKMILAALTHAAERELGEIERHRVVDALTSQRDE